MSTAFFKIVSAMIAALEAEPAVCDTIYRARPSTVPDQLDLAVNVQWDQAGRLPAAIRGAPMDWDTRISVECYARSMVDSGDVAVDPLLEAVHDRLAQDTTLGDLVGDLNLIGLEAETTQDARKTGWVRLTYIANHSTSNGTLN